MPNQKYPKQYTQSREAILMDPFRPEFMHDSLGRFILPLPGYSKAMALSVTPGSKNISQSSESESSTPQTSPSTLQSGYIYASTAIKVGPQGGWIVQIAGGDFQYPISYFNETTGTVNFYVDKNGNVYLSGTIYATVGEIGGWTISATELYAGSGVSRVGLRPGSWPFYAGNENPTLALARIDVYGNAYFTSVKLISGDDIGNLTHLDQVNTAEIVNAAVTFDKMNKWFAGKMGTSFPGSPENGEEFLRTDENRFYRYSSVSGWIPVDYHTDDARFANSCITNAKILSLDAGKITTGYLAAERLNTAVIYISQQAMIANAVIVNAHIVDLNADKLYAGTITAIKYQTATSGARVVIDPSTYDIAFYASDGLVGNIWGTGTYLMIVAQKNGRPMGLFATPAAGGGAKLVLYVDADDGIALDNSLPITAYDIRPWNTSSDLGNVAYNWRYLYVYGIYLNGSLRTSWPAGIQYLSELIIDISKNWQGYGISNMGSLSCTTITTNNNYVNAGSGDLWCGVLQVNYPYSSASSHIYSTLYAYGIHSASAGGYDLGTTSYYWNNCYFNRIYFTSGAGQIYYAGTLAIDFYTSYVKFPNHNIMVRDGCNFYTPNRTSYPAMVWTEIGSDYTRAYCRMDICPDTNNQGALGYSDHRWQNVYASNIYCTNRTSGYYITGGDYRFSHRGKVVFTIKEDENFLLFLNQKKEVIMKLDQNGKLFVPKIIKGRIKQKVKKSKKHAGRSNYNRRRHRKSCGCEK